MTEDGLKLSLAVGQMDCVLGDVAANLEKIRGLARSAAALGAALAVLPETATTGYFLGERLAGLAEPADGPTDRALGGIAREAGLHLAVGTVLAADGGFYDCQSLFGPDGGRLATYRKAHLFAAEKDSFRAGDEPVVVPTALGGLGLTVCYDMIFADYFRTLAGRGAGLILNSTNWIGDQWQRETWGWRGPTVQALAATRALENGVVVAMANRVGRELQFDSMGHSCIAGPSGRILASLPEGEGVAVAHIDYAAEDLKAWRALASYRKDRRPELYADG